jgi:hypothetical protein
MKVEGRRGSYSLRLYDIPLCRRLSRKSVKSFRNTICSHSVVQEPLPLRSSFKQSRTSLIHFCYQHSLQSSLYKATLPQSHCSLSSPNAMLSRCWKLFLVFHEEPSQRNFCIVSFCSRLSTYKVWNPHKYSWRSV